MRQIAAPSPHSAAQWIAPALLSLWAAVLTITLFSASKLYSLPMIAGSFFPVLLYVSRNPRAVFLLSTVFTAALGLSINFQRTIHIGGAPSYSIDLMDVFLIPLVVFLIRDFAVGYRRDFKLSSISGWWLGMVLLGMMDMLRSAHGEFAAFEVVRMLKCWLLFIVIVNECTREQHFHRVVLALMAGVSLNVGVAFVQYLLKRDLGLQALGEPSPEATLGANYGVYLSANSAYRVGALMGHPNLFSAYLGLLLPIFIGQLYTGYRMAMKFLLALVSVLGCVALVLTLSRSGWASFALAMGCLMLTLFVHPALRTRHVVLKMAMIGGMGVVLAAAAEPIIRRISSSDAGATDFRHAWVEIAWRMVKDKPVFGFGLNTFSFHIASYTQESVGTLVEKFGKVWPVVHNIYMLTWSEQGTIGFMLFIGLHLHVLFLAIRNAQRVVSEKVFMVNVGAACGILAVMLDGLSSFFIRVPASARIFWIVVALIVAAKYWNERNGPLREALAKSAAGSG